MMYAIFRNRPFILTVPLLLLSSLSCMEVTEPDITPSVISQSSAVELYHENDYMTVLDWEWYKDVITKISNSQSPIRDIAKVRTSLATGVLKSYLTEEDGSFCKRDSDCASGICNEDFHHCIHPQYSYDEPSSQIRGTCGITFISPSYAVTAAHCVNDINSSMVQNGDSPVLVEMIAYGTLSKTGVNWRSINKLKGGYPNFYRDEYYYSGDGYMVYETECELVSRCANNPCCGTMFECDNGGNNDDVALLKCNNRPGETFSFLPLAKQEVAGERFMHWKHEVFDIEKEVSAGDLYDHYVLYNATNTQNNFHYHSAIENQLLPLMSRAQTLNFNGVSDDDFISTTLSGCHGTSGSGVLLWNDDGKRYELSGPAHTGPAIGNRLCYSQKEGEITYANVNQTKHMVDIDRHKNSIGADCSGTTSGFMGPISRFKGHIDCTPHNPEGFDEVYSAQPLNNSLTEGTLPNALSLTAGTTGTLSNFFVQQGRQYRLGLLARTTSTTNPILEIKIGQEVVAGRIFPETDKPWVAISKTWTANQDGMVSLDFVPSYGNFEIAEVGLLPEGDETTFRTVYGRSASVLMLQSGQRVGVPYIWRGGDLYSAPIASGQRLVLNSRGVSGRRWTVRVKTDNNENVYCGLLNANGDVLVREVCDGTNTRVIVDQTIPPDSAAAFFVEPLPFSDMVLINSVGVASEDASDNDHDGIADVLDSNPIITNPIQSLQGQALYADEYISIHDRTSIFKKDGVTPETIYNSGNALQNTYTVVGADAFVGSVISVAPTILRERAKVDDLLMTTSIKEQQQGVQVGTKIFANNMSLPKLDCLGVDFPTPEYGDLTFNSPNSGTIERELPIKPNTDEFFTSYGDLFVGSHVHLKLTSGTYFFDSVTVWPDAQLLLDTSNGPIYLYVKSDFFYGWRSPVIDLDTSVEGDFFIGYLGSAKATIGARFAGTLVAPNAIAELWSWREGYEGAIYAKMVILHQDSQFRHVPFPYDWNMGCETPTVSVCGNGITEVGESCDDGNEDEGDSCNRTCQLAAGFCGNNILNAGEACDDGNANSGDGCDDRCRVELTKCGDGVLNNAPGLEECDDGNTDSGDGCSEECQIENGECGDGTVDPNEQCDDSNTIDGDGCSSTCEHEQCGDNIVDPNEQCDEGSGNTNSGVYGSCTLGCTFGPHCGDGEMQTEFEVCDNGLTNDDTIYGGCTTSCEFGPRCGDGILQNAHESCDDGDTNNDGSYNGCNPNCSSGPYCGDGTVQTEYETCDDGVNDGAYNGCQFDCTFASHCGDGVTDGAYEECDDGNDNNDDDCTNNCQLATTVMCENGVQDGSEEGIDCGGPCPDECSPCLGICQNPDDCTPSGSFQSGNLDSTREYCFETYASLQGIQCSNFDARGLEVNETENVCSSGLPTSNNGGYCIFVESGGYDYASFSLW